MIEFARHVCGLANANSTEVDPDAEHRVIYKLQDLLGVDDLGGTMRLGSYACELRPGSRAAAIYGATEISERHRHRYEFNQKYEGCLERIGHGHHRAHARRQVRRDRGGAGPPWFVAVQYHPEFKSRPLTPHPLFDDFVRASLENRAGAGLRWSAPKLPCRARERRALLRTDGLCAPWRRSAARS